MNANELAELMSLKVSAALAETADPNLPTGVVRAVASLIEAGSTNCALVAFTNVALTTADPTIQTNLLSKQAGGEDSRSLYKKSVRPHLVAKAKEMEVSFIPSEDPYVSNPFREPKVDAGWVAKRKNKLAGAEELRLVLEWVSDNRDHAKSVLISLAQHLTAKLELGKIAYDLPPRMPVSKANSILAQWLAGQSSGGARLEIAATALLRHCATFLAGAWDRVESHQVNDPVPYDQICWRGSKVIALGECKDQEVTIGHIMQLADQMRGRDCERGFIFTRAEWLQKSDQSAIDTAIAGRNLLGYRIDIIEIGEAVRSWLPIIDRDDGDVVRFMKTLTTELDLRGELKDRQDLAKLIDAALR